MLRQRNGNPRFGAEPDPADPVCMGAGIGIQNGINHYEKSLYYFIVLLTGCGSNWQPTGSNPFYGSVDGQFIASKEIKALGSVPPGSKAVVIHPAVQARMEQDPASELLSATAAKVRLADMLKNGNLLKIFGDEISGVPTETILAMTQAQIWGGGAIL